MDGDAMTCGCRALPVRENDEVVDFDIDLCPLHGTAQHLLDACKAVQEFISDSEKLEWNESLRCWTIKDGLVDPLLLIVEAAIEGAK